MFKTVLKSTVLSLVVTLALGVSVTSFAEDQSGKDGWRRQGDQRPDNRFLIDQAEINLIRDSLESQGLVENRDFFQAESSLRRDYGGKMTSRGGARQEKFKPSGDIS